MTGRPTLVVGYFNISRGEMARVRKPPTKKGKLPKDKKPQKQSIIARLFSPVIGFIRRILRPLKVLAKPFQNRFFRKVFSILRKVLLIDYVSSSWQEVKQVEWPDRKETAKLTVAVFAFAIVFGVFVAIIDFGLDKLFREVIL